MQIKMVRTAFGIRYDYHVLLSIVKWINKLKFKMAELHALHLVFSLFQISELARKPSWIQPTYFQAAPRDGMHMRIPGVIVAFWLPPPTQRGEPLKPEDPRTQVFGQIRNLDFYTTFMIFKCQYFRYACLSVAQDQIQPEAVGL